MRTSAASCSVSADEAPLENEAACFCSPAMRRCFARRRACAAARKSCTYLSCEPTPSLCACKGRRSKGQTLQFRSIAIAFLGSKTSKELRRYSRRAGRRLRWRCCPLRARLRGDLLHLYGRHPLRTRRARVQRPPGSRVRRSAAPSIRPDANPKPASGLRVQQLPAYLLTESAASTLAPPAMRHCTICTSPARAARINAVQPSWQDARVVSAATGAPCDARAYPRTRLDVSPGVQQPLHHANMAATCCPVQGPVARLRGRTALPTDKALATRGERCSNVNALAYAAPG